MKILPVESELFRADGQTDIHVAKLMVAFPNFAKAPKKCLNNENASRWDILELDCS